MKNNTPFVIYNASAGSGKTYTLVKEYLKILFGSNNQYLFKNILAITFTNKAVAEMKERIVDTLKQFSDASILANPNSMFEDLCNELHLEPIILHTKSEKLLNTILHNYAGFDISTIDGFTHKVIRTFAHDLKLPLNFEVELDQDSLLNEAVDKLINKAGTDDELTKVLINFAVEKADDDKSWDIAFDLNKIAKLLVNENDIPFINELQNKTLLDFITLKNQLKKEIKESEKTIIEISESVLTLIEKNGLEFTDFTRSSLPNHFKRVSKFKIDKLYETNLESNISEKTGIYNKTLNPDKKATIDSILPEIEISFKTNKQAIYHYKFLKNFYKNITPLSVLSAINKELTTLKTEQNKMLISEFNTIISKEIKDQPAPFIYERIGEKFNHYFIDEFQDTSVNQWKNLTPLLENTLSKEDGSVMIVGDAKQAIYRWRGGKAEQFMDLFNNVDNPFPIQQDIKSLVENYRSFKEIVSFNNDFFYYLSEHFFNDEAHKTLYKNVKQEITKKEDGYVELSFLDFPNPNDIDTKDEEEDEENDKSNIYPNYVLNTIKRCLENGYNLKDICVLVRKNKEGIAVANYLSLNQTPIISSETLLLSNAPEVNFTNSVLSLLLQPKNQQFKIAVLNDLSVFFNIVDKHTFFLNHINLSIPKLFKSLESYGVYLSSEGLLQLPLYELVESILRAFDLLKESSAYIQFYLDFVLDFSQKKGSDVSEFLNYFDKKKDKLSIVSPIGQDAVQIMTVHKSKGLQFPVVIFPYADLEIYRDTDPKEWLSLDKNTYNDFSLTLLNYNKDFEYFGEDGIKIHNRHQAELELDSINLLYVALTRAVEQLYVISKNKTNKKDDNKAKRYSDLLINYLKNLGLWNDSQSIYSFGNQKRETQYSSHHTITKSHQEFISTNKEIHNIKIITKSGMLWDTTQEDAIEKGNLVHKIMSEIKTKNDVDVVLESYKKNSTITEKQAEELKNTILQIVNDPKIERYFSSDYKIYNEQDIISKQGFIFRPDRIVINKNNEATIIDYKTGSENIKHEQQLELYKEVLEDMNFTVKEKILVYINNYIKLKLV